MLQEFAGGGDRSACVRTLLLGMLALGVLLGAVAAKIRAFHERERKIAELQSHRAHVYYMHELDGNSEPPGPALIRKMVGANFFGRISHLSLAEYDQPVTDELFRTILSPSTWIMPTTANRYVRVVSKSVQKNTG